MTQVSGASAQGQSRLGAEPDCDTPLRLEKEPASGSNLVSRVKSRWYVTLIGTLQVEEYLVTNIHSHSLGRDGL